MRKETKYNRARSKNYTHEEKRKYCLEWERSGQSKGAFCQLVGISKSSFYLWCNQFKVEAASDTVFSPVTLKSAHPLDIEELMQLEICLPNQMKLLISMQKPSLVSFIQELCHATAVIR